MTCRRSRERAVPQPTELERELRLIETTLRRLETEYNMFFSGQRPRPPWETRRRLETMVTRLDRGYITSSVDRFRLGTLQSRFATLSELWDRALRAREEGRPGPFSKSPRAGAPVEAIRVAPPTDHVVGSVTLADAEAEASKIEALYESVVEARKEVGTEEPFPFSRFADIVKGQVARLHQTGSDEVAFRVAIKEGRVVFTVRGVRTASREPSE
jgi:hypothetical protein